MKEIGKAERALIVIVMAILLSCISCVQENRTIYVLILESGSCEDYELQELDFTYSSVKAEQFEGRVDTLEGNFMLSEDFIYITEFYSVPRCEVFYRVIPRNEMMLGKKPDIILSKGDLTFR